MKKSTIFLMVSLALCAAVSARAGEREDRLFNSLMKEPFIPEKRKIAAELGRLGTPDAKAKLLTLLRDPSSWNRAAAVRGLFALPDASAGPELLDRMLTDHMIDDDIAAGFTSAMGAYYNVLAARYRSSAEQKSRERIIEVIGASKTDRGEAFLKGIIEDGGSADRESAFKNLAINYPTRNYQYIKSRRDTAVFRLHALTCMVEHGSPEELPVFRDVIEKREEARYRLIAFRAVNRWGDDALRHRVFLDALRERDENLAQGGMLVFTGVRSDAVMKELCRIVKKGTFQMTRMAAAMRLTEYASPEVIPPLVIMLRESYIQRERGGADIFATVITFGIASVFDDLSQKRQRTSFDSNKAEIARHLAKITGADFGPSYAQWYEWAILNGHTVRGENIIQHLFSGYRSRREKAVDQAIRLLGYSSGRDFYSTNGSFASDTELSLALAKMLIARGFLKNEE